MLNKIRAFFMKRKARKHYTEYAKIADSYSCGLSLAHSLNGDLGHHRNMFNILMDRLSLIDKNTPTIRLK